jgi:hypothetical protein
MNNTAVRTEYGYVCVRVELQEILSIDVLGVG